MHGVAAMLAQRHSANPVDVSTPLALLLHGWGPPIKRPHVVTSFERLHTLFKQGKRYLRAHCHYSGANLLEAPVIKSLARAQAADA